MCGIIGAFNRENAFEIVQHGLSIIKERGRDGYGYYDGKNVVHKNSPEQFPATSSPSVLGHALHAIVNIVHEPIREGNAVLSANCEIYNWEALAKKYLIVARNDADLLLKLINKVGVEKALDGARGVYTFCYWKGDEIWLARDILGIKPLWYSIEKGLVFCSEKKGIANACKDIVELNPRIIICYNKKTGKAAEIKRPFFSLSPLVEDEKEALAALKKGMLEALTIRIPNHQFGVLFSGGIDSVIVAKFLKDAGEEFMCYVAAVSADSPDVLNALEAAAALGVPLKTIIIKKNDAEEYLKKIIALVEDNNVVKVGVALPLYAACEQARNDGCKVIFSGSGADEVFGGYHRYKSAPGMINRDCYSDVLKLYEKNCYRDDVITMNSNLELRVPFLDREVVAFGLRLAPSLKLRAIADAANTGKIFHQQNKTSGEKNQGNGEHFIEKYLLRAMALSLGIPKNIAFRPKKAAQYGSGADGMIGMLAKKRKFTSKANYLASFLNQPIMKIGALLSSGKDSLFAAYIMKKQNYDIACAITLQSENPNSYMFHTPNVNLVKLQAEAMGIPLILKATKGEKEKELDDLKEALIEAKKQFGIEGIVSGALFSNYQRNRIERIGDELGLKLFSPLWHMDQEQELRQLLREGFEIIFVSVAAEGLDSSWLGRKITQKDVDELAKLNKKYGINIAGEGGEYESLVLDCPMFGERIQVLSSQINTPGSIWITEASIIKKNK